MIPNVIAHHQQQHPPTFTHIFALKQVYSPFSSDHSSSVGLKEKSNSWMSYEHHPRSTGSCPPFSCCSVSRRFSAFVINPSSHLHNKLHCGGHGHRYRCSCACSPSAWIRVCKGQLLEKHLVSLRVGQTVPRTSNVYRLVRQRGLVMCRRRCRLLPTLALFKWSPFPWQASFTSSPICFCRLLLDLDSPDSASQRKVRISPLRASNDE